VVDTNLPPKVAGFIADHVTSVAQLEVLLLLRARGQEWFSAADVGRELRIDPGWADRELRELSARGLVAEHPGGERAWRFAPSTAELADLVEAVADAYARRRVSVVNAIYSRPATVLRAFSNAFRLKKE
jgi:hypothetical protein